MTPSWWVKYPKAVQYRTSLPVLRLERQLLALLVMPPKRVMTLCLAALLIFISASLCCMPLSMQANFCHPCCTPSGQTPSTKCEGPRLDVDRAEYINFAVDPLTLAAPVAGVAASVPECLPGYIPVHSIALTPAGLPVTILRI